MVNDGWILSKSIIVGVGVTIFPHGEAVLSINERNILRFKWTPEAEKMFEDIDVVEPIELLEMLQRLDLMCV